MHKERAHKLDIDAHMHKEHAFVLDTDAHMHKVRAFVPNILQTHTCIKDVHIHLI